jgi:hypothetical protein
MSGAATKDRRSDRAVLKDAVPCSADNERALAPRGEYEIEKLEGAGACSVGLCSCATQNRFTLSFDAFLQHLVEGRIAVIKD